MVAQRQPTGCWVIARWGGLLQNGGCRGHWPLLQTVIKPWVGFARWGALLQERCGRGHWPLLQGAVVAAKARGGAMLGTSGPYEAGG